MDKSKLTALGERLKVGSERLRTGGAEISRKFTDKMKEMLKPQSEESKFVDEATLDSLEEPNWGLNMRICALVNSEEFDGQEVVRAIKKKIAGNNEVSQSLSLDLLETCAMNCEKVFSEISSERLLDDMVKMIDDPQANPNNRQRAMQLIQVWGSSKDLDYLPVFRQTYMNLKNREVTSPVEAGTSSVYSPLPTSHGSLLAVPEGYPYPIMDNQEVDLYTSSKAALLSTEEKRELLAGAKTAVELLTSLLCSETPEQTVKDELTLSIVEKCKESRPIVQRIVESAGDDEVLLFEALNIHEELEHVISKYSESEASLRAVEAKDQHNTTASSPASSGEENRNPQEISKKETQDLRLPADHENE